MFTVLSNWSAVIAKNQATAGQVLDQVKVVGQVRLHNLRMYDTAWMLTETCSV